MTALDVCSQCRAPIQPGSRYCSACGQAIQAAAVESWRRQLTILFCDVVDSTAIAARLDPEDWHDLLMSYHRVCRDTISRYEGHISQFLGDGVMAYFGYPIAQEDDAVRAVSAALRIADDIRHINLGIGKRLGVEIHVRAGLHTGTAVLGGIGAGGHRDPLATGESVNLAARIQTAAGIDTVVVSASTARLIGGHFELIPLDAQPLKGVLRPVELFHVARPTGARSGFEAAARGHLTPYVGRERELSELHATWEHTEGGAGAVVIVRGEAGIGKSRIVHHFRQAALETGARVVECFCSPLARSTALAPIIEMLQGQIAERAERERTQPSKLDALASMLHEHSRFGSDALPLLSALLSIAGADEAPIRELSPVRRRARTLELLRAWLAWSAERVPVALLIEDVHWADPSTLELLDAIVRENPGGRTLVCLTARPEFAVRWPEPQVRTIELSRLSGDEVESMVSRVAGNRTLPPLVVRRIKERSEGVPLFVEELTKAALESGALRLDGSHYVLTRVLDDQFLPATLQGSIVARFDRLGESRSIAQLGAAIGRDFSYALIRACGDLPEDQLRSHLERIGRSELAYVQGDPPNARYTFKHALIQDAIYGTLLKSERARVHERIFSALQESFPEVVGERPEMVAHHAEHAGRRDAAVPLLRDAGMKAFNSTAVAEAVKHLAHGLELVSVLHEPARTAMEIELQAALSSAYMATVGWAAPEVERSSTRLKDLAAAGGDAARLFQATWGLWTVHFMRGQLDLALDLAGQIHDMATSSTDPMLRVASHHAVGYTHFYRGEYAQAILYADQGLAMFDFEREQRIAAVFQLSPSTGMSCYRSQAQQMLGLTEQAAQGVRSCQKLAEELRHAPSRAYLLNLCYCFRLGGQLDQMKARAAAARALCVSEGFGFWILVADLMLAWVSAQQGGDAGDAAQRIEVSRKLLHDGGTFIVEPEFASMHAEVLLLAGRPADAMSVAAEALAVIVGSRQRHGEPELYRLQGEATRALGNDERALALYRAAGESARAMGARVFELRSALSIAQLLGVAEMRGELSSILDGFGEGRESPDCQRALALLGSG